MGGHALDKLGIKTERKSTKELYIIFDKLNRYFSKFDTTIPRFYRNKKTHGDLDILIKVSSNEIIYNIVKDRINPDGLIVNDNIITFDYDNCQVDLICIKEDIWESAKIYYLYDPLPNLFGKTAHGFGLRFGMDGLFYKFIGKGGTNTHVIKLTTNPRKIFEFLGFDYDRFEEGFDNVTDIYEFIVNGKFYDKEMFKPENLIAVDRKRSMNRPSYRAFLEYSKSTTSNFTFDKNKNVYIDYIDENFPGFKEKLNVYIERDNMIDPRKKFREAISNHKPGKLLGTIIGYYTKSKDDFNKFIIESDIEAIKKDFDNFYIGFNKNENLFLKKITDYETFKMTVKNYDITNHNSISNYDSRQSKEIPWEDVFIKPKNSDRYIKPYEKGKLF